MAQSIPPNRYPTNADGEVAHHETANLISSDKVEGTTVYDPQGNTLGSIDSLMIEKRSGHVSYAVLSFGGFLGMGKSHFPLPWSQLRFDQNQNGYVVSLTETQIKGAPHYATDDSIDWTDTAWRDRIDSYYGPYTSATAEAERARSALR